MRPTIANICSSFNGVGVSPNTARSARNLDRTVVTKTRGGASTAVTCRRSAREEAGRPAKAGGPRSTRLDDRAGRPPRRAAPFWRVHAADLWAVGLVTLGVLLALALWGDAAGPVGHGVDSGLGLAGRLGRASSSRCRGRGRPACCYRPERPTDPDRGPERRPWRLASASCSGCSASAGWPSWPAPPDALLDPMGRSATAAGGSARCRAARCTPGSGPAGAAVLLVAVILVAVLIATGVSLAIGRPGPAHRGAGRRTRRRGALAGQAAVRRSRRRRPGRRGAGLAGRRVALAEVGRRRRTATPVDDIDIDIPLPDAEPAEPEAEPDPAGAGRPCPPWPPPAGGWTLPPESLLHAPRSSATTSARLDAAGRGRWWPPGRARRGDPPGRRTVGPTVTRFELELGPGSRWPG